MYGQEFKADGISIPGPNQTFLSRVPYSNFHIKVLKKVGFLESR